MSRRAGLAVSPGCYRKYPKATVSPNKVYNDELAVKKSARVSSDPSPT